MKKKLTIAGIGEILWDVLPDAETLGGAPVNFAYHVNGLGATGIPLSSIGDDDRGRRALDILKKKNIETSTISIIPGIPTGFVDACISSSGSATYTFPDNVAWDNLKINKASRDIQNSLDAICFGTLAQRSETSRQAIHEFLSGLPSKTVKIYDVNLRQHFYSRKTIEESLILADIVKLSDEELPIVADLLNQKHSEREFLTFLIEEFSLVMTILTRGGKGSLLMTPDEVSEHPGAIVDIVDTIGAGDSFTAAAAVGYLQGLPLDEINKKANELASYVCSKQGAMIDIPDEMKLII